MFSIKHGVWLVLQKPLLVSDYVLVHISFGTHRVLYFGMIRIWISDPRSLGSWCIKSTDESTLDKDLVVLLMHHDSSDLGSLIQIWIIPKEHIHSVRKKS